MASRCVDPAVRPLRVSLRHTKLARSTARYAVRQPTGRALPVRGTGTRRAGPLRGDSLVSGVAGWILHRTFLRTVKLLHVHSRQDEESRTLLESKTAGTFSVSVTTDIHVVLSRRSVAWRECRDRRLSGEPRWLLHPAGI